MRETDHRQTNLPSPPGGGTLDYEKPHRAVVAAGILHLRKEVLC